MFDEAKGVTEQAITTQVAHWVEQAGAVNTPEDCIARTASIKAEVQAVVRGIEETSQAKVAVADVDKFLAERSRAWKKKELPASTNHAAAWAKQLHPVEADVPQVIFSLVGIT